MNDSRRDRYSIGAMVFHWVIALLIIYNLTVMLLVPGEKSATAMMLHKSVGISVLVLSIGRIIWRVTHPRPAMAAHLAGWEIGLAKITHALLYFLMIAVPFAGWGLHSAGKGAPFSYFGTFDVPAIFAKSRDVAGVFHEVHELSAFLLAGLVVLHIAGAIKHTAIDKDGQIGRMLPISVPPPTR